MNWLQQHLKGLLLCAMISALALWLSQIHFLQQHGISALTLAIVFGMLLGNSFYPKLAQSCQSGVNFAKGRILRIGIILYGFRLSFQQILDVGLSSLWIDLCIVAITFALGVWIGCKWLKIHPHSAMLIASGASICGAAAVLATAPVLKAKSNHLSVAIATVVIFGTVGMFLYPWLYQILSHWLPLTQKTFGIYIGSSVHEVAQVVAAGNAVGSEAANNAVITKMLRVMLLAPFLLWLSFALAQRKKARQQKLSKKAPHFEAQAQSKRQSAIVIPWFALGFVAMVGFNSLDLLPASWVQNLIQLDNLLLCMAMSALGLTTQFSAIKQAGSKPLLLAFLLFLWLLIGGAGLNYLFA